MLMKNAIAVLFAVMIAFPAFAGNKIYPNSAVGLKTCLEDAKTGRAVPYHPTTKNALHSREFAQKEVGARGACLTGAYVREDDGAVTKVGVVYVAKGFQYGEKLSNGKVVARRMTECSNPFDNAVSPEPLTAISTPIVPGPAPVAGCSADDCGNITETVVRTIIVDQRVICLPANVSAVWNGTKYDCPVLAINTPAVVGGPTRCAQCTPAVAPRVHAPAPPVADVCPGGNCRPHFNLEGRRDNPGRCVVAIADGGRTRYVRLDRHRNSGRLMAAEIASEDAELDRQRFPRITYVGDHTTTARPLGGTCAEDRGYFTSDRSFGPTIARLGFPNHCTVSQSVQNRPVARSGAGQYGQASRPRQYVEWGNPPQYGY